MKNEIKRKCQGCTKISKREDFVKITLLDNKLYVNPSKKILGRSMYVCADKECVKTVIKKKKLYSALKFKNFDEISKVEKLLQEMVS